MTPSVNLFFKKETRNLMLKPCPPFGTRSYAFFIMYLRYNIARFH